MRAFRLSLPILFISLSLIYMIMIFQLPPALLGDPYAPRYFPMIVAAGILIFAVIDLVNVRGENVEDNQDLAVLLKKDSLKIIGVIVALCVGYALIFEWVGFLAATLLFLGALMFYLNGYQRWVLNLTVTLIFSFSSWYIFSQLLEISLP
ncbi:tripartite tricarboxylate transporter TctB family protein [Salicibibacter halophilus]|uniref:Tripartite tricarboxylate transporter TctB family protein n=1 Tax=Salicibibacter halophilus TaxID=2502791 RepID=A0A514LK19_9BACI|nr:tripartite tricarboxylate transporter TctB family protein [Salicibibacter halophilus]QDI92206.1 tripartite tricarboxylate transporter TctB family protein [Salicibibacter halophilus]